MTEGLFLLPPPVAVTVCGFVDERAWLGVPDGAVGECWPASRELADTVCGVGVEGVRLVVGEGPQGVDGPAFGVFRHAAVAVRVCGAEVAVDVTARQLWADEPWPLVEPLHVWAARFSCGLAAIRVAARV